MKILISIILIAVLSIPTVALGSLAGGVATAEAAGEKVVFLRKGGTGNGSSADSPVGTLDKAYSLLGDAGGRIVLCGGYTMTGAFEEPVHNGVVTVTQNYNDIDYRDSGSLYTGGAGRRYILNGPTVFENIKFTTQNKGGLYFICQYNRIEFAEGVVCEGFDGSLVANAVTLLGGEQIGLDPKKKNSTGSHIVVKSGSDILIAGLCRQMKENNNRSAKIEIYGGQITTLYGGNINGGKGRSAEIVINGGKFTGKVACEYGLSDSVKVSINAGDFSSCKTITGTAINSEVTVAENVESTVTPLLSGFKTISTASGVVVNKVPEEVFGADTFTSSDGTSLPYRYYYPEGYDEANADKYPIFVYFHGNGSRGTDNKTQLGATHALVNKVLNYGIDCVIVAPQAPKTSAWILDSEYPGGTGFDNTKAPKSKYLSAAIELINTFLADEKIDRSRLYIGGGSNGAAACWSIIARNPRSVAGAIILAGTGATGKADVIAPAYLYTPIRTFHGDADKTLSVEGTRGIVNAVNALGGTLMDYIEMPGRDHDIWVDAAHTAGLYEWLFAQQRTGETPLLAKTLDSSLLDADYDGGEDTDTDTDIGTDTITKPDTDTPADSAEVTTPVTDTATDSGDNGGGNAMIPIAIGAAVAAIAAAIAVIIIKKKKK